MLRREKVVPREDGTWEHSRLEVLRGNIASWYEQYGITTNIVDKPVDVPAAEWNPYNEFSVEDWFPIQIYQSVNTLKALFVHVELLCIPSSKFVSLESGVAHRQVITDNYRVHSVSQLEVRYCKIGEKGSMVYDVYVELPLEFILKPIEDAPATSIAKAGSELLQFSAKNINYPNAYLDSDIVIAGMCVIRFGTKIPAEVVAGAIYDFAGYLSSQDEVIEVGATAHTYPLINRLSEFLKSRNIPEHEALIENWADQVDTL